MSNSKCECTLAELFLETQTIQICDTKSEFRSETVSKAHIHRFFTPQKRFLTENSYDFDQCLHWEYSR